MANALVPYVPKNFIMSPNFQLVGPPTTPITGVPVGAPYIPNGALVPQVGGLPARIPSTRIPSTGFTLEGGPSFGGLQPYSPFEVSPMQLESAAASGGGGPSFGGLQPLPSAATPGAVAAGEGGGSVSSKVAGAVGEAAPEAGLLSRLLTGLAGSYAGPVIAAGGPFVADPGSRSIRDKANPSSWAWNLQTRSDDTGLEALGKAYARGAYNIVKYPVDAITELYDYLTKTPDEIAKDKADHAKMLAGLDAAEGILPDSPQPRSYAPAQSRSSVAMPEYVIPGMGSNPTGENNALDSLMGVLAALKPQKGELPAGLNADMHKLAYLKALDWGLPTNGTLIARIASGQKEADINNQLQGLQLDQAYGKQLQEWMKDFAKTGVDVEKTKAEGKKGNFKIHSTKGGFLVEMDDGQGNKVLKPIAGNIFGDAADPKKTFSVMGRKFAKDNPLSTELGILQNMSDVGVLNDILVEHSKELMPAAKGLSDPKQIQEAQILALARAMHDNPNLSEAMRQKFVKAVGQAPNGINYDPQYLPPPEEGAQDFLSQLVPETK